MALKNKFAFPIFDNEITITANYDGYDGDVSIDLVFSKTVPNPSYEEEHRIWKKEEEEYQLAMKKANDDYEAQRNNRKAQKIADREIRFAKRIECIMKDKNFNNAQKCEQIEFLLKHNEHTK